MLYSCIKQNFFTLHEYRQRRGNHRKYKIKYLQKVILKKHVLSAFKLLSCTSNYKVFISLWVPFVRQKELPVKLGM